MFKDNEVVENAISGEKGFSFTIHSGRYEFIV